MNFQYVLSDSNNLKGGFGMNQSTTFQTKMLFLIPRVNIYIYHLENKLNFPLPNFSHVIMKMKRFPHGRKNKTI